MIAPRGRFLIAGDWHGHIMEANRAVDLCKTIGVSVIVHVGDFGIDHNDKPFLNDLQKYLEEAGVTIYFVDGNHDNLPYLSEKKIGEDGTRKVRDNIYHLPRGFRWEWHGFSFLALGGAASINKAKQVGRRKWWPEEAITAGDVIQSIQGGPVDVMFSHDSPEGAPNPVTDNEDDRIESLEYFGKEALDYCEEHRRRLKVVTDIVTPRMIFHGHYHRNFKADFQHGDSKSTTATVFGLNQGLGMLSSNVFVFDFEKGKKHIELLDTALKE